MRINDVCLKGSIIFIAMFVSVLNVNAYYSFGSRAEGMGGAFSAVVDDATGVYWNPAALALISGWSVTMDMGSDTETAEDVQKILDSISISDPRSWEGDDFIPNRDALDNSLNKLETYSWIHRGGDGFGLSIGHSSSAFSIIGYDIFYIQPQVDRTNMDLDPESTNYIGNNDTKLHLSGFQIKEYGFSYAWLSQNKTFSFGITGKYVDLKGYDWTNGIWDESSMLGEDLLDRCSDGLAYDGSDWGIDAGIMFLMGKSRISIVGRNLRSLEIDVNDEVQLEIKPEYRMGYAFFPTDRFTFAVDYATSENRDPQAVKLDGKEIALGFEAKLGPNKFFVLRGGSKMELGGDAPLIWSGGVGLAFEHLSLDAGIAQDQDGNSENIWCGISVSF